MFQCSFMSANKFEFEFDMFHWRYDDTLRRLHIMWRTSTTTIFNNRNRIVTHSESIYIKRIRLMNLNPDSDSANPA